MNPEEVKKVFEVIQEVDGRCSACVSRATKHFSKLFPAHRVEIANLASQLGEDYFDDDDMNDILEGAL